MIAERLKGRIVVLFIAVVVAWLFGIFEGYYTTEALSVFPADVPLTLLALSTFAFGFLFFGYPSPFIMFFIGVHTGDLFTGVITTKLIVISVAAFCASYAAIRLGDALLDDMLGTGNFNRAAKISMLCILAALAVSILGDFGGIG
jgi:hypothetical protein